MSSGCKAEEKSFKELLLKINHSLLDIRCRSLRSIVFKLNNGLVSSADLVNEKQFLAHLLEWFNFEEWALESQVLILLSQLSEHEKAASALVDMGGVEFLSQLRLYCEPSLHSFIDEVLEHLLKLPQNLFTVATSTSAATTSIPSTIPAHSSIIPAHFSSNSSTTSTHSPSAESGVISSIGTNSCETDSPQFPVTLTDRLPLQGSNLSSDPTSSYSGTMSGLAPSHQHSGGKSNNEVVSWAGLVSKGSSVETEGAGLKFTYTGKSTAIPEIPPGQESAGGEADFNTTDEKFLTTRGYFPWIRLTTNDRHILTTTQSRLENPSPDSLLRSCEFLEDVLFQDFPPELFLQRPDLIKSLIRLLVVGSGSSTHYPCLMCLLTYIQKLKLRIHLLDSPISTITDSGLPYDPSHWWSHNQVPHPQASTSDEDLEFLTSDMVYQLQSNQLTIGQFSSSIISFIAPLVIDYIDRDFPWLINDKGSAPYRTSALYIGICLQLLECAVQLLELEEMSSACKQHDESKLKSLRQCISDLCPVISQCHSKWRRMSSQMTGFSPQLQLICCVTLDLGCYLNRLLQLFGKGWSEEDSEEALVVSLKGVLQGFMMNGVVGIVCPDLQNSLFDVFREVDPPNSRLFSRVQFLSKAFEEMSQFLSFKETGNDRSSILKQLQLALDGLPGLWFMCEREFICKAIHLCLDCLTKSEVADQEWQNAKELLVKLLCHGEHQTHKIAYRHFTKYLRNILSPPNPSLSSSTSQSTSSSPSPALKVGRPEPVILNDDVLYQIVTNGTVSRIDEVRTSCLQLLEEILSLRTELYWPRIRDGLIPLLPYLEVGVVESGRLFQELKVVLSSPDVSVQFPPLTQLHSLLRLLYSDSTQVRVWSYTYLSQLVVLQTEEKTNFIPSQNSIPYHDILIVGWSQNEVPQARKHGTFKHEDVLKLLHIMRSETMDLALKKSALEQLSLLLQDCKLHKRALEEGLCKDLLKLLKFILHLKEAPPSAQHQGGGGEEGERSLIPMLKPCISCFLVLAVFISDMRRILSESLAFMMDLFKAALWSYGDTSALYMVSKLMALLVFVEEIQVTDTGQVLLPAPLRDRLKFPFDVDTYDVNSTHATPSPLEPSLYTSEPLLGMLRMHYFYSTKKSISAIISSQNTDGLEQKLHMPSSELTSLHSLALNKSLTDYCDQLTSAGSHRKVMEMLQHISVVLHTAHRIGRRECGTSFLEGVEPQWRNVIDRFLMVSPSTTQDHVLLASILVFLSDLLSFPSPADSASPRLISHEELGWLTDVSFGMTSVPLQLLQTSLHNTNNDNTTINSTDSQRFLQKSILHFYGSLLKHLASEEDPPDMGKFDPAPLITTLNECLDIAGSPSYYDIPLLELSLESLLNLTDRKILGSVSSRGLLGLSLKLMSSLRQVLWSFISGRGKIGKSFMGKGVISRASLAMSHLMHTTATRLHPPEEWWLQWLRSSEIDLVWMQCLVADREPGVRFAGLSLLSFLCIKPVVTRLLLSYWGTLHSLSLWGICMKIALDMRESSLVRKQSFLVLAGLSAVCTREKTWTSYLLYTTKEVTLTGKRALELLLDSYKFFEMVQHSIQSDSLHQLSDEIPPLVGKLVKDKHLLRILVPVSQYTSNHTVNEDEATQPKPRPGNRTDPARESDILLKEIVLDLLSLCDPLVVSGMCSLLHNLLLSFPNFIATRCHHSTLTMQLTWLLDPKVTGAVMLAASRGILSPLLLSEWTKMYSKLLGLLEMLVRMKPDLALPFVMRDSVVEGVCRLMAQCEAFMRRNLGSSLLPLASAITSFLLSLVGVTSAAGREIVFSSLQFHWSSFTGLLLRSLDLSSSLSLHPLSISSLKLLSSLLTQRFRPYLPRDPAKQTDSFSSDPSLAPMSKALEYLLDENTNPMENACAWSCDGGVLCKALMKVRDCNTQTYTEKWRLVNETLGILLACSSLAKKAALEGGLLELSIEELKVLHTKLCAESLEQPTSRRKKESPTVLELTAVISLLRNFMYRSQTIKAACLRIQLPSVLHRVWPSCTVNRQLLLAVVSLINVYAAQHSQGRVSLASSSKGTSSLFQDVLKHTSHSLSCYQSCVSSKIVNPHAEVLGPLFSLLANSSLSQECRAIMKRTGFICGFTKVQPKTEKLTSPHQGGKLSSMWIRFLVNLSFSTDGQMTITKTPGIMETLMDVYGCGHPESNILCLLILRNISFYGPSKAILINDKNFLNILVASLESDELIRATFAASAFWALLYNSSKIRHSLRKFGLKETLLSVSVSSKQLVHSPVLALSLFSREHCTLMSEEAVSQAIQLLQ